MDSFDFNRLDDIALEQTLTYLNANPEPQGDDVSFVAMLKGAVDERDWLESPKQLVDKMEGQSTSLPGQKYDIVSLTNPLPGMDLRQESQTELTRANAFANQKLQCTWDGCAHKPSSETDLQVHMKDHVKSLLDQWIPWSLCMWEGCQSKAKFQRRSYYESHLKNIHTEPLMCNVPRCLYKKPFRNQGDLRRYRSTAHSEMRPYQCPFATCQEETKTFARRDKWLKHIRETPHENDGFCVYHHCQNQSYPGPSGFQTRGRIASHYNHTHSAYESDHYVCDLGSCSAKCQSERWTESELSIHLQKQHGMAWYHAWGVAESLERLKGTVRVLTAEHLEHLPYEVKYSDCTICTQL